MADTERCIWDWVRAQVVGSFSHTITQEQQIACQGQKIADYLQKNWNLPATVPEVERQIKELKAQALAERPVQPIPGAVDYFRGLHELGFNMAVASSSDTETVTRQANEYGIADCFQQIMGFEVDVPGTGKQALFLQAALRLGVRDFNHVVVFEDAKSGVAAAKKNGMHAIAVPSPYVDPGTGQIQAGFGNADFIIPSLRSINLGQLR